MYTELNFPAGDMPRSYIGPFNTTNYVAVGGVTPENIPIFLDAGCIGIGLGNNMMPKKAVENDDWENAVAYILDIVSKITK